MALIPGAGLVGRTVGFYRIEEQIGAGGMGVVYRAEDTRLGRNVALKFLSATLIGDDAALKRFDREAQAASALNHPNICTIHEIGHDEGTPYLVMELLKGESLRQRLAQGPLTVAQLLEFALAIADALDAAHSQGIIHRDLKPANVFITDRGVAKLVDFGLAKVVAPASPDASTRGASGSTGQGVLGTLPYMSPEQVRGLPLDSRTDLFSFGAVLYEMITGTAAFDGDTTGLVFENVLTRAPAHPGLLNHECPPALEAIISKALEKDRDLRYQSAREMLVDLKRLKGGSGASGVPLTAPRPAAGRLRLVPVAAIVAGVTLAGAVAWRLGHGEWTWPGTAAGPVRLELGAIRHVTSLPGLEDQPALSPDGKLIAFVWQKTDNKDIWVKQVSGGEPLQLTDDPADDLEPDWSPDGSTIVFRSERRGGGLYAVPALRGDVSRLTDFGFRPRWSPDGRRILFQLRPGTSIPNEIYTVDYPGGTPGRFVTVDTPRQAEWAPDGRRLAFSANAYQEPGLFVAEFADGAKGHYLEWEGKRLPSSPAIWAAGGRALLVQSSTLGYVPLDATSRAAGPVTRLSTSADQLGDVSADGSVLAYVGGRSSQSDIWKIALNPETGLPVGKATRVTSSTAVDRSPRPVDNRHFLFISGRDGGQFLYVADLDGQHVKLVDKSRDWRAVNAISPDGRTVVLSYRGDASAPFQVFILPFDPVTLEATSPARRLGNVAVAGGISPDGRYLLFSEFRNGGGHPTIDAWERFDSDRPAMVRWPLAEAFLRTHSDLTQQYFSADGRWIFFEGEDLAQDQWLFALRPGDSEPRPIWKGGRLAGLFPQTNPNARRVYVWRDLGREHPRLGLLGFDPVRGEVTSAWQHVPLEPGPGSGYFVAGFTPDGRWLLFEWTETEGDIFVADLIVR